MVTFLLTVASFDLCMSFSKRVSHMVLMIASMSTFIYMHICIPTFFFNLQFCGNHNSFLRIEVKKDLKCLDQKENDLVFSIKFLQ